MTMAMMVGRPHLPQATAPAISQPSRLIVVAVKSGDPAQIAAAVSAEPDLAERAAIRQYDGNMPRIDAELATLLDALDEAGFVL